MKAVAFVAPGKMEVREFPEPEPSEDEVVVSVAYSGICGSDIHEFTSHQPSMRAAGVFQPIMGHEFTGVISALGPGVSSLSTGDPVVVHPGGSCGNCFYCNSGVSNLCADQIGTGYRKPGAYAERVAVRADQALKLPDASWLERAALTEPLGVALRSLNRGALQPGETVFIAGAGPIGLLTLLCGRIKKAGRIIISEPAESRRALALKLGANDVVDPANVASVQVRELTGGLGADLSVEAVGITPTMNDCLAATRRGGRIVLAGVFDEPFSVNLLYLLIQEQSIIGTFGYADEFREARDLIVSNAVNVGPLISAHVGLDELPDTFAGLATDRSKYQKVLLRPNP
ncbi:MAG TPA: alcohol dehydrogenase catalytic domain-containing protein [Dehalococcoidia bacterium]|nr:alcohol dehydrogenase catalytic domain-containing protein [Dehalococcoidia bacterium]